MPSLNALRWDGKPGHYEVWYLTVTDPGTGFGLWIRYTMLAPQSGEPTCSLWFLAMDPRPGSRGTVGRKATFPASALKACAAPFHLTLGDATFDDRHMRGSFEDVAWDLRWDHDGGPYRHVRPALERAGVAQTVLVLPHADLEVSGAVRLPDGTEISMDRARGGQAHLWGSKHARRWCWVHCNDFETRAGEPATGDFVDGVSVFVNRFGREVGPSSPVVARLDGGDVISTGPVQVLRNPARLSLTGYEFEAKNRRWRLVCEVDAERDQLAGVTYHDPDGELAYCYNSETATMRVKAYERTPKEFGGWALRHELVAPGRAHFEYAQREPLEGLPLHTK
jgi:hypothetical protein